jgi:hypothetical protein
MKRNIVGVPSNKHPGPFQFYRRKGIGRSLTYAYIDWLIFGVAISVLNPLSINTLSSAAATAGAAASRLHQQKRAAYAQVEPNGYPFVPFSVERYGRLGQPAMKQLAWGGPAGILCCMRFARA